ncbi:hypothetical protein THRCLA_21530 [Thraustotheca clavata]|uniref:Uncharacterized protein n=1 Tax=Thraustotheca clavata TaxID=74557 RepID=A0A1V9ZVI2_9STRA|nr:hypothetical protein THRCLA_21530 [Thraustotheca clavata]
MDAIQVLEFCDIFYFDPFAKQWKGCLKTDDVIQTAFGEVAIQMKFCFNGFSHTMVLLCAVIRMGPWIAKANDNET